MSRMITVFVRSMCSAGADAAAKSIKPPISIFGIEGRYVSALYSAGVQLKTLDEIEKSFKELQKLVSKPKIQDFIETSLMSKEAKAKLLWDIGKEAGLPPPTTNFLVVVAENGRLKNLKRMINMFLNVMVAHRKEALCEVITATPLDDGTREKLMEALKSMAKGKNITLTEKVDSSIIGGMVVGIEDKHIDMSIARKILMYTDIIKQAV